MILLRPLLPLLLDLVGQFVELLPSGSVPDGDTIPAADILVDACLSDDAVDLVGLRL